MQEDQRERPTDSTPLDSLVDKQTSTSPMRTSMAIPTEIWNAFTFFHEQLPCSRR